MCCNLVAWFSLSVYRVTNCLFVYLVYDDLFDLGYSNSWLVFLYRKNSWLVEALYFSERVFATLSGPRLWSLGNILVVDFAFWICLRHYDRINGSEGGLRWRCRKGKLWTFFVSVLYTHKLHVVCPFQPGGCHSNSWWVLCLECDWMKRVQINWVLLFYIWWVEACRNAHGKWNSPGDGTVTFGQRYTTRGLWCEFLSMWGLTRPGDGIWWMALFFLHASKKLQLQQELVRHQYANLRQRKRNLCYLIFGWSEDLNYLCYVTGEADLARLSRAN